MTKITEVPVGKKFYFKSDPEKTMYRCSTSIGASVDCITCCFIAYSLTHTSSKCCRKHKCDSIVRSDGKNVHFIKA